MVVGVLAATEGRNIALGLVGRHLILPGHLLLGHLVHHPRLVNLLNHILHILGWELVILLGHRVHRSHVVSSLVGSVHLSRSPLSHGIGDTS